MMKMSWKREEKEEERVMWITEQRFAVDYFFS
jgi:hypothetical protein